jgi:arylsulfatase A-like enzyme
MGNPNAGPYAGLHQGFEHLVHRFPGRARLPGEPYLIQRASEIVGPDVDVWIAEHRDRNFFLYLHLVDPHGAYDAPPPYDAWFNAADTAALPRLERESKMDPPGIARPTAEGRRLMYDGEILYNDRHIGDLLERLESTGALRNTLVIFASDHGEFLGLRAPDQWGHHPPGFAQVTHVPLAMVLPGVLPADRRITQPIQLIDVLPTVLELAGIDGEDLVLQGKSLVPLLRDSEPVSLPDRVLVSDEVIGRLRDDTRPWGSVYFDGLHFLNSRKFFDRKELASPGLDPTQRIEAFRFLEDPAESANLALDPAWQAWRDETSDFLQQLVEKNLRLWAAMTLESDDEIRLDPQVREQLKGLGYIQ